MSHRSTPRGVRARCLETMQNLIKRKKKLKIKDLKVYILRQFLIRPETFDRYLKELAEMKVIRIRRGVVEYNAEPIFLEEVKEE